MKLFLTLFCHSALVFFSDSEVCLPTWTEDPGHFSIDGIQVQYVQVLQHCMAYCERNRDCLAIDFNNRYEIQCWLHTNPNNLLGDSFYNDTFYANVTQYRIHRNCTDDLKDDYPVQWIKIGLSDTKSANGTQVNYWTEYDCFTYCRYTPQCVAVDFDNKTNPPCWFHEDPDHLSEKKSFTDGAIQYRINKTIPPTTSKYTGLTISRCVGQWFLNDSWCPPGMKINISDAELKQNPLCCYRNDDNAYPPDASWLTTINLNYLDPNFYEEIVSCEGNSSCYLMAKTPLSHGNSKDNQCPNEGLETNFVSISYNCISTGSTHTSTAKFTIPLKVTDKDDPNSAPVSSAETNNNLPLILGLAIGLGGGLLLIFLILIILIIIRQTNNRKAADLTPESSRLPSYYYSGSTVNRGAYPDKEENEVSVAVDTVDDY